MNEGTAVLEHLNFFNKVISGLLAIDAKIDEEDKALILFNLLPDSYDYIIIIIILYSKKTHILEDVTSTLLSNEISQIKRSRQDRVWQSRERKEEEKKKGSGSSKACHFCHRKHHWMNDCKH